MEERAKFVLEWKQGSTSVAELCRQYGISRPTGYKYIERYSMGGIAALQDLPRIPQRNPQAVSETVERRLIELRRKHPSWGPRKLRGWLERAEPHQQWPATSTIGLLLKRAGLVVGRRRRRKTPPMQGPLAHAESSNRVWCIDFKGWFLTGDGHRCDPFTATDAYSRYLLRCQALKQADTKEVKAVLDAAFREYGLPERIRSDNGAPFATRGVAGLSRLSVWWVKLGILPERIRPGHPEDNGRHERMHRTLKAETTKPPARNRRAQQQVFDEFRKQYNEERPHEALKQQTPGSVYVPSVRPYPRPLEEFEYPHPGESRPVQQHGQIYWRGQELFVGEALAGERVGIVPADDGRYQLRFGPILLGFVDQRRSRPRADR